MKNSRSFFYDSPSALTRGKEPRVIYFSSWGSRRSRRYYIFFYIFRNTKFSRNYDTLQWYFCTSHHPRVNFGEWLIIFALKWTLGHFFCLILLLFWPPTMQQKKTPFFTRFKETLIKNVWKKEDLQTEEENIWRREKENIWKEKELGGALMDELSTCVSLGPSFRYIWNGSGMGGNTYGRRGKIGFQIGGCTRWR